MDGAAPADRRDNLWAPLDDEVEQGAHGDFDDRAHDRSYEFWARTHAGLLTAAGVAAGALAQLGWARRRLRW
jgi:hypothetical protein